MANIEKIAREICDMSRKDLDELRKVMKDEYGIEPNHQKEGSFPCSSS